MSDEKEKVKYPENLILQELIAKSGKTKKFLAKKCKVSKTVFSNTINGHYKGTNIVPKLLEEIGE